MKEFDGDKAQPKKPPPVKSEAPAPAETPVPTATPVADTAPAVSRRGFHIEGLKLRFLPIVWTVVVITCMLIFAQVVVDELFRFVPMPGRLSFKWMSDSYDRFALVAMTLAIILFLKLRVRSDFGLHLPRGKWLLFSAIVWGLLFGIVAAGVEHDSLLAQIAPRWPARLPSTDDMIGWTLQQGLVVAPSDELLYRGLLSTYLASRIGGRIVLGRFELSVGGFLVALFVALTYIWQFVVHDFLITLGLVLYVFVSGIFFAYWFEKSRSLLTPVIGHSIAKMAEFALIFVMLTMTR